GLLEEIDCPGRHRFTAGLLVFVARDEDDGDARTTPGQALLQLQPTESAGHTHVQNQAIGRRQHGGQEVLRTGECLNVQPHRPEQAPQRLAYGLVIVDDEDGRPRLFHVTHYSSPRHHTCKYRSGGRITVELDVGYWTLVPYRCPACFLRGLIGSVK